MSTTPEPEPSAPRPPNARVNQPTFAIVVTSTCDESRLRSCLHSLAPHCAPIGAKLIVAHAGPAPDFAALINDITDAVSLTVVSAPDGTCETDLRRIGARHAGRNIVAFVRDSSRDRIIWAQHVCRAWQSWCESGGRIALPSPSPDAPLDVAWSRPFLSVVVVAHDAADTLRSSLDAIAKSDLPRELWELVVVDDGRSDETSLLAAEYADRVVLLPDGPHGPGYARNRGFEMTLGECVAFVSADVMVRPSTLSRFYEAFKRDRDVGAVFGSYDARAMASDFVSQYHNLLQHFNHQRHAGDSSTFWSACGAVRGAAFEQAGCFDEWHFQRRQLEDLELGQRIRQLGYRVVLRPELQVTNLKRWTVRRILATEMFDRGIPWMRLVNRSVAPTQRSPRSPRWIKKINIALTWLGALLLVLTFRLPPQALVAGALACFTLVAVNESAQLRLFHRERGLAFAAKTVALDLLYYFVSGVALLIGWIAQHTVGEPHPDAATQAFAEMDVKTWPPVPSKRLPSPPGGIHVIETRADIAYSRRKEKHSDATSDLGLHDAPPALAMPPAIEIPPDAPLQ
jgi:glycosyltransferase involved in cell wall biosynthesis